MKRTENMGDLSLHTAFKYIFRLLPLILFCAGTALAYDNEVYESGGSYYWKINNVVSGSNTNLGEAINRCIWDGPAASNRFFKLDIQ